jgi:glucose-1-phosphate thymidylyltransferase
MAGGLGSRLHPLTTVMNKHLLPIYDKPMIYYPLSTLMLAGIREIAIVADSSQLEYFRRLFLTGENLGISISYISQQEPLGIAQGILLAEDFIGEEKVGLILGDNIFHGIGLGRQLSQHSNLDGAHIFAYQVSDPENYGVVEIGSCNSVLSLEEKPEKPRSNLAVPGLYFYDNKAIELTKKLKPSPRNELEITDLNRAYLEINQLSVSVLSKGTAWLDTGTFSGLHDASSFIRIMEERQNSRIGDPYDVALAQEWVNEV